MSDTATNGDQTDDYWKSVRTGLDELVRLATNDGTEEWIRLEAAKAILDHDARTQYP